jgi:hypothetical protein|tara:strand:- start:840 stop:1079 length:240 start_codon:yes stop_codon:yes gene_type:complete
MFRLLFNNNKNKGKTMKNKTKTLKIKTNGLFAIFSDKELEKHIKAYSKEEQSLLWLGVMFGQNNVVNKLNKMKFEIIDN